MFEKKPVEKTKLELAIDDILAQMDHCDSAASDEFEVLSTRLAALYKLKEIDQKSMIHETVSGDVKWKTVGLVGSVVAVVLYEQKNIFGTKSLAFLQKIL